MGIIWTYDEINFLKENFHKMKIEEIAKKLGRSIASISKQSHKLKLVKGKKWTIGDDQFLKNNYANTNNIDLSKKLERTVGSIIERAIYLQLKKSEKFLKSIVKKVQIRLDIKEEIEIIKKINNGEKRIDVAKEYNISIDTIGNILKRNGKEKITNRKYFLDENYFEIIDTEDKAYWLGFLYADGYIIKDDQYAPKYKHVSNRLGLELSIVDKDHIKLFLKYLKSDYPIKDRTRYDNRYDREHTNSSFCVTNTKIVYDLIDKGCVPTKSFILKFPDFLGNLTCHFIRGYFDGDGCIQKYIKNKSNLYRYRMTLIGNYDFLIGVKNFLNKVGLKSIIISKEKNMHTLRIYNYEDCLKFYNLIYGDIKTNCFLKRKKNIYDGIKNYEFSKYFKKNRN